jgi:ribonuclease HI
MGWVFGSSWLIDHHANKNNIRALLRQAILIFVIPFITLARKLALLDKLAPPPITTAPIPEDAHVRPKQKWQLYTDAAIPKNSKVVGIGILITRFDTVWFTSSSFIKMEELPAPVTSTIGEYAAANAGLKKAIELLPANTTTLTHWADNLATVQQTAGEWHVTTVNNLQMVSQVRETRRAATFHVLGAWLPRAQNTLADHHAKLGAKGTMESKFPGRDIPEEEDE